MCVAEKKEEEDDDYDEEVYLFVCLLERFWKVLKKWSKVCCETWGENRTKL